MSKTVKLFKCLRGKHLALLPLAVSMPLLYWPHAIEYDTQPWVIIGTFIAFLFYWPNGLRLGRAFVIPITICTAMGVVAYWARTPETHYLIRYAGIMTVFLMLWHIGSRKPDSNIIGSTVRVTLLIWFAVGAYQIIAVRLGLPVVFFGRYVGGYSGVPSLAAEPSFYGSISALCLMYLITEKQKKNKPYIIMAIFNVVMSGSLLSMLLLLIPAIRLPIKYMAAIGVCALIILMAGNDILGSSLFNRLAVFEFESIGSALLLRDTSINLRFGHIWFTFFENIWSEILFLNPVDFWNEYNNFAHSRFSLAYTESDFILPSGGELLFRSGIFGLIILILALIASYPKRCMRCESLEKVVFTLACFANPISLANPFFIFYIHKGYRKA